ncbi:MAG: amino acid permease [Chitinophagaceae bacterium]|nr:amino acid permease [Chitinophagaceae bacterium]
MANTESSQEKLGFWTSTSLVIGNMIGGGIFLMPAALAAYGGISLLGWVFSAAGAFFMARVFSNLSRLLPNISGGPYAYTRRGFGDFMGFLVAWGYWISIWCSNAAITVSIVSALSTFIPALNGNPYLSAITGLSMIWLLTWVNTRGVVASGKMQLVTTILKIVPLILVAFVGIFFIKKDHFIPFNISNESDFSALTATAAMTLFAYLGLECATIPAANVANPEKTIPRATITGTSVATFIYILVTISVLGIIPAKDLQQSVTPLADTAAVLFGQNARYWVSAGVVIAGFGALNGWIMIQGQIPAAIAKDKLFPPIFGKENKKGVPASGILISSVLVSLLLMMNYTSGLVSQFKALILLSTLCSLVPYLFSMAAYLVIRIERKHIYKKDWIASVLLALGAFAFAFWAIAGAGQEIVYKGFLLLLAGVPFYIWINRNKQKED